MSFLGDGNNSYQYQLQSMWQKCWNQNAAMMHGVRYRERGPMKSWRPETMAEAIWSVLHEGLSLSQAARKHDIPYPTFVLYANRVHNMLGPSLGSNGASLNSGNLSLELRPKGRGRPQRILLGNWPEEHVRQVIRAVVFRDGTIPSYNHAPALMLPRTNSLPRLPPSSPRPSSSIGGGTSSVSPPMAPPPTPSSSVMSPQPSGSGSGASSSSSSKLMENFSLAAHLKQIANQYVKEGAGPPPNLPPSIFDTMPFKAFMNEAAKVHSQSRGSMDFEDAEEDDEDRDGDADKIPKLIPASGSSSSTSGQVNNMQNSSSDTTTPLSEDPMNLVETSWEMSTSLHDGGGSEAAATASAIKN